MLTPRKRLYFKIFAISIPFIFLFILELAFRLFGIGRPPLNDPYILLYSPSSIFQKVRVDGEVMLRVYRKDLYSSRNIQIPEKKPAGKIRVFCVGGSASAGWPHQEEHSYSRYLAEALKAAYPTQKFEVHNLSGHAFGSNRVRLIFDELLALEPDLMILYTGNNEFLEERFYKKPTKFSKRMHQMGNFFRLSRVFAWTEGKILKKLDPSDAFSANRKSKNRESIESKVFQRELALRKNPEQFASLLEHYKFNVEEMLKAAKEKKIPTLVLSVPVNLRGWKPNVSSFKEGFDQEKAWKKSYNAGRKALFEKDYQVASQALETALKVDSNYAETYFWLGESYYQLNEFEKAREAFLKAVDLDYNPFRALTQTNDILRQMAKTYETFWVDLEQKFSEKANGCPGYELFLDYVHPNVPGNLLIAETILAKLQTQKVFGTDFVKISKDFVPYLNEYNEKEDQGVQHSVLFLCGMMHQYERMVEVSQEFLPIARDHSKTFAQEILDIFSQYLAIQKKEIYGNSVSEEEKSASKKKVQEFYQKHYVK